MKKNSGQLLHNLLLFGRLLRGLGLDVNPGRMIDLVNALDHVEIGRKTDFYYTTRTLLVHRREDIPPFDEAFEVFWRKPQEGWTTLDLRAMGERRRFKRPVFTPPPLRPPGGLKDQPASNGSPDPNQPPIIQATLTYSPREALRHKDFSELTGEELEEIKRLMSELVWQLGMRRTRRLRPGNGAQVDLRRTIRGNLK